MASLQKKIKDGRPYWYVIEVARVQGQPRVVRQRYLGTVASLERALDATHEPEAIEEAIVRAAYERFGVEREALVLDATNFHTFIASTNPRAPVAARGHAKNKRTDLRLVGLALACSTDHRIPLASKLVEGNSPDVRTFERTLPVLLRRLEAVGGEPHSGTVGVDQGNNSA